MRGGGGRLVGYIGKGVVDRIKGYVYRGCKAVTKSNFIAVP